MEIESGQPAALNHKRPKKAGVVTAVVAAFVLVSGVVGWAAVDGSGGEAAESGVTAPHMDTTAADRASGSGPAGTTQAETGVSPDVAAPDPSTAQFVVQGDVFVRSATLTISVENSLDSAVTAARDLVTASGGFVSDMERSSTDDGATASLTLRVPAPKLESALAQLEKLGEVRASTQSAQDVTQQSIDIDARLRSLTAEADALRSLLARAGSTGEILEIRRQLNDVSTQIEVLQAQRQALDQQIAMSTISVSLLTPGAIVGSQPSGFWSDALGEAWERLQGGVAAILVGSATLIPFALLALLVFVVARAVWLRRRSGTSAGIRAATGA